MKTNGGYFENGVRILTGNPTFYYSLKGSINLATIFLMTRISEDSNFIMGASSYPGSDTTLN